VSFSRPLRQAQDERDRREILEKKLNIALRNIACFSVDPEKIAGQNCENMIGVTQVPLGVAGPIKITRLGGKTKEYYIPLATTEGALVASVSRGCKAVYLSGGATVRTEQVGTTRAPVFQVKNLEHAQEIITWVKDNFEKLKQVTESTDKYITLFEVKPFLSGRNLFLRFVYDTSEAMGMNMVTVATHKAVGLLENKFGVTCISLSGNMCVDKKPSWLNFILGRGKQVWAEVFVKRDTVREVLKTTPEKIVSVVASKTMVGSQMSGSLGFNSHFANIVAALFIATGQDPAHIVEGSMGITSAHVENNGDLYFSVYLPAVLVGTVGGGTGLATQKEALKLLGLGAGCKGQAFELAQIVAGAVLAGELSLVAALAEGHLARAHERLGRGKKT